MNKCKQCGKKCKGKFCGRPCYLKHGERIPQKVNTKYFEVVNFSHREPIATRPSGYERYWLTKCKACNEIKPMTGTALRLCQSCGCRNYVKGSQNQNWKGAGNLSGTLFSQIKKQAKRRNIPFEISIEYTWKVYESQNSKCALSGRPITLSENFKGRASGGTASLDRIDSSKGYIKNNIQWLHKDVNFMKQSLDESYFVQLCREVADNALRSRG